MHAARMVSGLAQQKATKMSDLLNKKKEIQKMHMGRMVSGLTQQKTTKMSDLLNKKKEVKQIQTKRIMAQPEQKKKMEQKHSSLLTKRMMDVKEKVQKKKAQKAAAFDVMSQLMNKKK